MDRTEESRKIYGGPHWHDLIDKVPTRAMKGMTKDERRKFFASQKHTWELLENGRVIDTFESHNKAKNAKHWKEVEAKQDWLDLNYDIRKRD